MTNANRGATPKFDPGHIRVGPEAAKQLHAEDIGIAVIRHTKGDWGEVSASDREMNDRGLAEGSRVRSSYRDRSGQEFVVLTDLYEGWTDIDLPYDDF
jgi:hypothetical protein